MGTAWTVCLCKKLPPPLNLRSKYECAASVSVLADAAVGSRCSLSVLKLFKIIILLISLEEEARTIGAVLLSVPVVHH